MQRYVGHPNCIRIGSFFIGKGGEDKGKGRNFDCMIPHGVFVVAIGWNIIFILRNNANIILDSF